MARPWPGSPRVNGQQEKIETLEKHSHSTDQELQLLRKTAVERAKATDISFAGHILHVDDLQIEGIPRDSPTWGRLPGSEMDYAFRLP